MFLASVWALVRLRSAGAKVAASVARSAMEFPKHSRTELLVLLVNEIEHLQAKFKTVESCIHEARAAAEGKIARLEEQYASELRRVRAGIDGRRQQEPIMDPGDSEKALTTGASETEKSKSTKPALQRSLQDEIDRLLHEAQEKNRILQDRNDELVRVKAELDRLYEQLNQSDSATRPADTERAQAEYQAHIAFLQAELSQKQWLLEEKQATLRILEQKFRQEIDTLRRRLAERGGPDKQEYGDVTGKSVSGSRPVELVQADREHVQGTSHSATALRRWRSLSGQKRRWRQSV